MRARVNVLLVFWFLCLSFAPQIQAAEPLDRVMPRSTPRMESGDSFRAVRESPRAMQDTQADTYEDEEEDDNDLVYYGSIGFFALFFLVIIVLLSMMSIMMMMMLSMMIKSRRESVNQSPR